MPVGQSYRRHHWTALRTPEFINRSSFARQGNCKAGYAVTATEQVIRVRPLPVGTSTKRSKIALNVWTDAKYAFGVAHTYGTIWKEQGVLTHRENKLSTVYIYQRAWLLYTVMDIRKVTLSRKLEI